MSKKMMLLALSVVGAAMFALPGVASATPAHIDVAEPFTVSGSTPTVLETTTGEKISCHSGVSGSGAFETTTTGSLTLEFHGCTTATIFGNVSCTTHPSEGGTGTMPSGTIRTTNLPFHLIMIANHSPGVLITPAPKVGEETVGSFAHFTCAGIKKTVTGNGVIGTITSPTCDDSANPSTTATLNFEEATGETGIQKHTTYTGVGYHLISGGNKASQKGAGQIHFKNPRWIDCT